MCGIAGMVGRIDSSALTTMVQELAHRGPDEGAVWMDPKTAVGLGHRRLKILDLSPQARQPMVSQHGRMVVTFNGEIFNFPELRDTLLSHGYRVRSHGDAEVLANACEYWGDEVVEHLVGQFAFAAWDRSRCRLFIARDHLGIKPLYYHEQGGELSFASEAKALLKAYPETRSLHASSLGFYLTFLWTPGEDTLFSGIRKLAPGSWLSWESGTLRQGQYWTLEHALREGVPLSAVRTDREDELRALLARSVQSQCASDVPLGVLLSGGVDSTIILAELRSALTRPLAFTATYPASTRTQDVYDEDAPFARQAASALGADLREALLDGDVLPILTRALWHLDEPLADPTVVTNYLMMREAKQHATVVLSGMGADEMFGGYPRHRAARLGYRLRRLPTSPFRLAHRTLAASVRGGMLPLRGLRRPLHLLRHLGGDFATQYIGMSSYFSPEELTAFLDPDVATSLRSDDVWNLHHAVFNALPEATPLQRARILDLRYYLPCLNLENMDKTSMAHAVEQRVPFLDHRLVTYALRLPDDDLIHGRSQKHLLREAYRHRIPDAILRRPKTGYNPPVRAWVRSLLHRDIADLLLSADALGRGLWKKDVVVRYLEDHRRGWADWSMRLWTLTVLELWYRTVLAPGPDAAAPSASPLLILPSDPSEVS